jgi:Chaperone of endosialidase
MSRVWSLVIGITGLVLILSMGPSWGQVPPGNDKSDDRGNTGGGREALSSLNSIGSGELNTAYGLSALGLNQLTGSHNTAVGGEALAANISGQDNTAVGFEALFKNDAGDNNTAVGVSALEQNVDGNNNTSVGVSALEKNVDGNFNTAVGARALESLDSGNFCLTANVPCTFNTAVGFEALQNGETGFNNTALGSSALLNSTGNNNTAIGTGAGSNLQRGDNNIYLRALGAATDNNVMRLGRGQARTFIAGIANASMSNGSTVVISSAGQLGVQMSSARYKRDIQTMGTRSQGLLQLRPVTFRYKEDEQGERHYGLIAEEVVKVYPELVTRGANGKVESVRYQELIPMLLNEQQQQQRKLVVQAQQMAELQAQNARLQVAIQQQQERDAALAARLERLEAAAARAAALASR